MGWGRGEGVKDKFFFGEGDLPQSKGNFRAEARSNGGGQAWTFHLQHRGRNLPVALLEQ